VLLYCKRWLRELRSAPPVQAVFTVLSTSGLKTTRLGTVLTTAAILDDIFGMVMVQVFPILVVRARL